MMVFHIPLIALPRFASGFRSRVKVTDCECRSLGYEMRASVLISLPSTLLQIIQRYTAKKYGVAHIVSHALRRFLIAYNGGYRTP